MVNATESPFKVLVVGAGIGGLTTAISCCRQGMDVLVLEAAPQISEVGAGIQIPPNSARIMTQLGLSGTLESRGAVELYNQYSRRYEDGRILLTRKAKAENHARTAFGAPWWVIHRADYQRTLLEEAARLGTQFRLNALVTDVDFSDQNPNVTMAGGEKVYADVIVGADGLRSTMRERVLGRPDPPVETGDLAYRATIPVEKIVALNDPKVNEHIKEISSSTWYGPNSHAVLYPVRNGQVWNLVLLRPDNIEKGVYTTTGDIEEMKDTFANWDPILTRIISLVPSVNKWKLCHRQELELWTKGHVILIGDAVHPTLPYQAQGAAMAVEDGFSLGILLGKIGTDRTRIPEVLRVFESIRKTRTTTNVKGAIDNRRMYHMLDGPDQEARDAELAQAEINGNSQYGWADRSYQTDLLAFDTSADCEARWKHHLETLAA